MGMSSSAYLAFGIDLDEGDEDTLPWLEYYSAEENPDEEGERKYEDIEDWWIKTQYPKLEELYVKTYEGYPEDEDSKGNWKDRSTERQAWTEKNKFKIDDYWKQRRDRLNELPVEIVLYCGYDYPQYILAVKGTVFTGYDYSGTEIEPSKLVVSEQDLKAAQEWCKKYAPKLDFSNPKWLLASIYG